MPSTDTFPIISAPRRHAGSSWLYIALGFVLLLSAAAALGVLLARFIEGRPLNLREHTVQMADRIENTLENAGLARSAIHRTAGEARRDDRAVWFYYDFEAKAPENRDPALVVRRLAADLPKEGIKLREGPVEPDRRSITFDLAGHEFASLTLLGAVPPPPEPADLRGVCRNIAELIRTALLRAGVAEDGILPENEEEQQDEDARWTQFLFRAEVPESTPETAIQEQLKEAVAALGALVTQPEKGSLTVAYLGRCIAEIRCVPKPLPPSPAPAKFPPQEDRLTPENLPQMEAIQTGNVEQFLMASIPSLEELPLESAEHEEIENGILPIPSPLAAGHLPRIALILDDGGYGGAPTRIVLNELDPRLTLAILPNTPHGRETAERAKEKGFEIMLHMPMETHSRTIKPFPGQINVNMGKEEIQRLTEEAIAQTPGLLGINNHTGSKFTDDAAHLAMFMEVVKKKGLYFIDSRTFGTSKGCKVARQYGVRTEQRNIFLDNDSSPAKIQAQLAKLIARAKTHGQAIGIGHFREHTVAVLQKELPKLREQNVELVHVSELVR